MWKDFKAFIAKGNVMDLAVGVIIGAAFGAIVTSLTGDLIMPLIGRVSGGVDFTTISPAAPAAGLSRLDGRLCRAQEGGAAMIGYGAFLTAVINFVILAFVIFLLVRFGAG